MGSDEESSASELEDESEDSSSVLALEDDTLLLGDNSIAV
jgi:hypothetical protein